MCFMPTSIPYSTERSYMSFEIHKERCIETGNDKYAIICKECEKEFRIDVEQHTGQREVKSQVEALWLRHRIECPKRFISDSLVLETRAKFESNFAILMAHHFGIKTEAVMTLYNICRSWDITMECVKRTLQTARNPSSENFIQNLHRLVGSYEYYMTINKIARAAGTDAPIITPAELAKDFGSNSNSKAYTIDELKDVFVKNKKNLFPNTV